MTKQHAPNSRGITPILSNAKGHCNSYGKTRAVIPIPPLTNARELSRS